MGSDNRKGGTGLGLYIVHSIVTELGGTISVYSTVGKVGDLVSGPGSRWVKNIPQTQRLFVKITFKSTHRECS